MSRIYLLRYENYYNRRCPNPNNQISSYQDYILEYFDNVNFNPNDGVSTEIILNTPSTLSDQPDYLIVLENMPVLASRWWIMEAQRTRSGQMRYVLRRDLVADFYSDVINAPAMIQRGLLNDTDPYIFNDEGLKFNQIKQGELLITDETEIPWVVGYLARTADSTSVDNKTVEVNIQQSFDFTGTSTTNWGPYSQYVGSDNAVRSTDYAKYTHTIYATDLNNEINYGFTYSAATNRLELAQRAGGQESLFLPTEYTSANSYSLLLRRAFVSQITSIDAVSNTVCSAIPALNNADTLEALRGLEGKVVKVGLDEFYKIELASTTWSDTVNVPEGASEYYNYFQRMKVFTETPIDSFGRSLFRGAPSGTSFKLAISGRAYYLTLKRIESTLRTTIPSTRRLLNDAPYSMFAIPYGEVKVGSLMWGGVETATILSAAIARELTSAVYDIQLVPYCPVRRAVSTDARGTIDLNSLTEGVDYSLITRSGGTSAESVSFILWAEESSFTFDIRHALPKPYDTKTTNQCTMSRLCSPNYSAIYEFNLAKSNGVKGFNVDCKYQPYSPYIHLWPIGGQGSLYGEDWDDPRGLICSGDFSMTATTSQWSLYEVNNKNYQNMFNRQIETMDLTHKIQRRNDWANAITGTISGGLSGAGTGASVGGGWGAVIGAAVGTTASGVGAGFDISHAQQLRANERDQAFDVFRMSNENIQARPDTLTKVSAFTPNNKIFPVYEFWSATAAEISSFQDYIKYRSMNVNRVDTILNYIGLSDWNFVQASFVWLPDLADDAHVAFELNNELMKGVYFKI